MRGREREPLPLLPSVRGGFLLLFAVVSQVYATQLMGDVSWQAAGQSSCASTMSCIRFC